MRNLLASNSLVKRQSQSWEMKQASYQTQTWVLALPSFNEAKKDLVNTIEVYTEEYANSTSYTTKNTTNRCIRFLPSIPD